MENVTSAHLDDSHHNTATTNVVTSAGDVTSANHDDLFYMSPDYPALVFDASAAIMIVTGTCGAIANFAIIILFMISPNVSSCNTTLIVTTMTLYKLCYCTLNK
jgi:hypothetical protein